MRLIKAQVEDISKQVLKNLMHKGLIIVNVPEEEILHRMVEIFTQNLMIEDELDREVKKILEAYETEFKSGKLEYMKMFNKVKEKLIKERDMII